MLNNKSWKWAIWYQHSLNSIQFSYQWNKSPYYCRVPTFRSSLLKRTSKWHSDVRQKPWEAHPQHLLHWIRGGGSWWSGWVTELCLLRKAFSTTFLSFPCEARQHRNKHTLWQNLGFIHKRPAAPKHLNTFKQRGLSLALWGKSHTDGDLRLISANKAELQAAYLVILTLNFQQCQEPSGHLPRQLPPLCHHFPHEGYCYPVTLTSIGGQFGNTFSVVTPCRFKPWNNMDIFTLSITNLDKFKINWYQAGCLFWIVTM